MRVVPRRNKGRRQGEDAAAPASPAPPPPPAAVPDRPLAWPPPPAPLIDPPAAAEASGRSAPPEPPDRPGPSPAEALGQDDLSGRAPTEPIRPVPGPTLIPEPAPRPSAQPGPAAPAPRPAPPAGFEPRDPATPGRAPERATGFEPPARDPAAAPGREPGRESERATAVLPVPDVPDADRKRRARAEQRRRAAAETKRSRAANRQGLAYRERPVLPPARAADQHRSALVIMVLTLGLLIAAVAVTGGMIAASMRTQPVTLAAPLHVYPVTQASPGQCPAGTPGITGQSAAGVTCYRLAEGIAIHKVADLRVQKSRGTSGYDVALTLRPVDRHAFARLTRATVGRDLAFVVRDRLVTLPRVDMPIVDGKVVVTGSPNRAAANRLVHELKGR